MISAKRLAIMARKWQKMAAGKRKRISYTRSVVDEDHVDFSATNIKGHFVAYSMDHKRFVVPLKYLSNKVFKELLKWSEEEFGLNSSGPIVLPCDGVFLDYVISLLEERVPKDVEEALIASMATCHGVASSSLQALSHTAHHQHPIIRGY